MAVDNSQVSIINSEFGKEGAGNESGAKAGAVLVTGTSVVEMTADENGTYNSMNYNTATGFGGAVFVNEGRCGSNDSRCYH